MASFAHRRQVLLFLVAVVLPCTVLIALGMLIVRQERELNERRRADESRLFTQQIRQELSSRLSAICANEAARLQTDPGAFSSTQYTDPTVVVVARLRDGNLILPWEQYPNAERARHLLREAAFARNIANGESAEFAGADAGGAVAAYERALNTANDPVQLAYARLLLGRASSNLEDDNSAMHYYRAVLDSPSDVTDEYGIALWSYAAARMLAAGNSHSDVLSRVTNELDSARWFPPSQLYLFRGLVDTIAAEATEAAIVDRAHRASLTLADRIKTTEHAASLEDGLMGLPLSLEPTNSTHPTWALLEDVGWLVGAIRHTADSAGLLIAVNALKILESLEAVETSETAAVVALGANQETEGELLGAEFPGLKVQFTAAASGNIGGHWDLRRWFYLMAVFLVVSVTLFGAYLLMRDLRRELAMAEMRSRFVSSVSHELKTPLTAIRMFAETLRLRAAKPETQADYLDTIVSESERLTRLLNNVLDFTKIERGAKEYRREPQDLGEIVRVSARAMQYPLEQKQFDLNVNIGDDIPPVNVDRDAIEQAILNLLANAMKYSGESRDIALALEKVGSEAVICVSDSGVGIAAGEQERIFDRFYRAKTDENQHIPGTGLGLTLVDHIAKAHDGYVTVESEPGTGSKFAIHLPLEEGVK